VACAGCACIDVIRVLFGREGGRPSPSAPDSPVYSRSWPLASSSVHVSTACRPPVKGRPCEILRQTARSQESATVITPRG
jgi:hypothetical protein